MSLPEFDQFYVGLFLVLIVVAAAAYVWEKGLLGTATEARIKTFIAKARHDLETWEAKLAAKQATSAPAAPTVGDQLIALHDALTKGAMTQAEYDAEKAKILKP